MKKIKFILNLTHPNGKILPFLLLAFLFSGFAGVSAQEIPKPKPAKTPKPTSPDIVTPKPTLPKVAKTVVMNEDDTPAEKSVLTESKVKITLCVKKGNIRINGWDRDEVRAYVENGSAVGFKVIQANPRTKKPVWLSVLGYDPKKTGEIKPEECLSGEDIELDVPRNAIIDMDCEQSEIKIESVARVAVKTLSGDIYLNNIANGVEAVTYEGDLTVEKSGGQMNLGNTAGNIIALDVAPSEIGDIFKAKTNSGRITLKAVEHLLIDTNSISGSTSYDGDLLSGAKYGFSTQNGSIVLSVPPESVCRISAWYGFGAFASEIPLQNALKKEQSIAAQIGAGEATCSLDLKTGSGGIRIRNGNLPVPQLEEKVKPNKDKDKYKEKKQIP